MRTGLLKIGKRQLPPLLVSSRALELEYRVLVCLYLRKSPRRFLSDGC